MEENYRIFSQFGPNAGDSHGLPKVVRFNLNAWYGLRSKVVENNAVIASLIKNNRKLIPDAAQHDFEDWLDHIDAFSAHVVDRNVDYRDKRFPSAVTSIVNKNA